MAITRTDAMPRYNPKDGDIAGLLTQTDVARIAELFSTPLRGTYCWDYRQADDRIAKLYRIGKERNWNTDVDIDWSHTYPRDEWPFVDRRTNPYPGWHPYDQLSESQKTEFAWHQQAWNLSQFLHAEQGALLVASQLVSCAPTYDGKLYASSQTFDEARHVEVLARYLREHTRLMYPINGNLKSLLDRVLTDERWDLKFIGMQLVIESLALAAFNVQKQATADPLLRTILEYILRDEARHVAFGVVYMEHFVKSLSEPEREDRALFAFEACCIMRERIVPMDVFEHYGFDAQEGRQRFLRGGELDKFRNLLFSRIMPNLNKVGLLTGNVKKKYEELGLYELVGLPHDGDIDWDRL